MIAIEQISGPCRIIGCRNNRIEMELAEGCLKCVQHRRWCRNKRIESVQSYAGYADSRAAQPIAVDELGVVSRDVPGTVSARTLPSQRDAASCRVAPIKAAALDDAQSSGR